MIEGRTRGDVSHAKQMLSAEPGLMQNLLERIARSTAAYLKSQIAAGACAVQLFDTWAGELTPAEYERFELPATQSVFEALDKADVPKILFAKGSARHLKSLAESGANVLSVDSKTDLAEARRTLGQKVALQGNVDPAILLCPVEEIRSAALEAVEKTGGIGHILNLGHGILPATPVKSAEAFVEAGQKAPVQTRVDATGAESKCQTR
jgi:uroporphyrinogen decarboxylase